MKRSLLLCTLLALSAPCRYATGAIEFETARAVPGVTNATRLRLDAGPNGDFHLMFLEPAASEDNEVTAGRLCYLRYRAGVWSPVLPVADLGADSVPTHYADVAGDSNGDAHVIWVNHARKKVYLARITDASAVLVESRPVRNALRAEIVVDSLDTVRALYRDKGPEENWLLSRPVTATNWPSATKIPADDDEPNGQRQLGLAAGRDGKLFFGYRWMTQKGGRRMLALREFDGHTGRWSGILDKFSIGPKPWGPQLAVDPAGRAHLAWNSGDAPGVLAYRAPDGALVRLGPGTGEHGWPPSIAVTTSGEIIIVGSSMGNYRAPVAAGTVEYRTGRGTDFTAPRVVEERSGAKSWGVVAARKNSVMLAWVEAGTIRHRTDVSSAATADSSPLPGQIVVDPDDPRWFKRHGGGPVYICGPGDPENFLYRGIRNPDGTRNGDQMELIDKLARHGGNCIYMQAVRTHGGDARDDVTHNPFVDSNPAKGLDDRIVAQWEEWFTLMDENGILIYFFFYDDGSRLWDTGDAVGEAERNFFESLVRRFKHHRNLIWMVGEESEERYTTRRVQSLAGIIQNADNHGHPIGTHHNSSTVFKAWQPGGALNHFSMQLTAAGEAAHAGAIMALRRAEGRYPVIYSESTATPQDADGMRQFAWHVAMGGVMPMLLTRELEKTSVETCAQWRILQRFFESVDFTALEPHDEFRLADTRYVLADPGRSYVAYSDDARSALGLRALPAGHCRLTWLDCRTGLTKDSTASLDVAGDRTFQKPASIGGEAALWVHFPAVPRQLHRARDFTGTPGGPRLNQPPVVVNEVWRSQQGKPIYLQLTVSDDDGPGPYDYTIVEGPMHGTLTGDNNDRTYTPDVGFTGVDEFSWKVHDGADPSTIATVTIRVSGSPEVKGVPPEK